MNPDSNFSRDMQVISITASNQMVDVDEGAEVVKVNNEN